ncbi:unnamed protein product [Bursaphelenchus okinawaensis]|uniref:ZP domain-containing protein n=1 Tax=Bursaphelenchus okinawaensis TaxID=465554 RepID=A0A811KHU1_9BILA|nr:unnamed protein product [Bursaphelenchus okinawaensis]CAG9103170.1 unnamed protein product [Bursaphelenchus okinawaensis]
MNGIHVFLFFLGLFVNGEKILPAGGQMVYAYNLTCEGKPLTGILKFYTQDQTVDRVNLTQLYYNHYFTEPEPPSKVFVELKYKCKEECHMYEDQIIFDINVAQAGMKDMDMAELMEHHVSIACNFTLTSP